MKARLAVVILAAPIWAWAAEGDAPVAGVARTLATPPTGGVQATLTQAQPRQAQPRQDLTPAGGWPAVQGAPARAGVAGRLASEDRLPQSGLQFYALIAAGIAAVGFMASRRNGS